MDTAAPALVCAPFPTLFSPLRLGTVMTRNRVMRAATATNLAECGQVGERMLAFHRTAAEGGAGVVVSEGMRVHPGDAASPGTIGLHDRDVIPGMRRLAESVHRAGAVFLIQLDHGGRQHSGRRLGTLVAPSAIACPRSGGVPHALTTRETEELAECFVAAAVTAMECGAAGVELNGAQGRLIGQFVSPLSNERDDRYGGSLEHRLRLPIEILQGIRRRAGHRAVIGYRMSVDEVVSGGIGPDQACEIADRLARAGLVDYISLNHETSDSVESQPPDRHAPPPAHRDVQRQVRMAAGRGMVVVQGTRIQTPAQAEELLASGDGDMVGLSRALIADPDWPMKARSGRAEEIRRCIACNQCWDRVSSGEAIGCAVNPAAGREGVFGALRPAQPGKVIIVGGGPAGLEAARIAAERGLAVTLYERTAELGGKLAAGYRMPASRELRHLLDFQITGALRAGVELRLGVEVDAELLLAEAPDAVILATGADAVVPELPSDGSVLFLSPTAPEELEALRRARAAKIVLMDEDGYFWASTVAEAVAEIAGENGGRLTVATRFFEPFRELPPSARMATLRALDRGITHYRTSMAPVRIEDGAVVLQHALTGREERVDCCDGLLWIGQQRTRHGLADALRTAGFERCHVIGDAFAPRRVAAALAEAQTAARAI